MAVLARRLDTQFQLLEAPPILKPAITPRIVESEALRSLRATLEASIASKLTSGSELVRAVAPGPPPRSPASPAPHPSPHRSRPRPQPTAANWGAPSGPRPPAAERASRS